MFIDYMLQKFGHNKPNDAIIWNDKAYSYGWLLKQIQNWKEKVEKRKIPKGAVVILEADFSPNAVALFLCLLEHSCILVPLTSTVATKKHTFMEIAQGEFVFSLSDSDSVKIMSLSRKADHKFYRKLRQLNHPGLVLFSSGSTGKSKAAVHDMKDLLEKFKVPRNSFRTITFLLYDHIGGVNTMLYTLSNTGCIVTVQGRNPDKVLSAVEKYRVELLPTSPTFINLILLSEAYTRYTLDSLKTVTYGTEPMAESTLKKFHKLFPKIRLLQTYGLSELGILRSKSKSSDSLWVKVGGEGFQTRIVNGILQIKAKSAMLGYLNAESPFTKDGWFNTGDYVVRDGEFIKILGRQSEIINVGGEKVYPSEVESVILEMENVAEVTVYREKNFITGNIVCAKVRLFKHEDQKKFFLRLQKNCSQVLENYKIPRKISIITEKLYSDRFKKVRSLN